MSLAQTLSIYLSFNLLIAASWCALRLADKIVPGARRGLRLHYRALAAAFALTLALPLFPKAPVFQPAMRVWSSPSIQTFARDYSGPGHAGYLALRSSAASSSVSAGSVSLALLLLLAASGAVGVAGLARDLRGIRKILRRSCLIRRMRRVSIHADDRASVPFSFWLPGRAMVVIPSSLLARRDHLGMALAHEMQHHRQADTRWVYAIWLVKSLCFLNPFAHLWERRLSELQEFACDEAVVGRGRTASRQYARCLVEVAQTALDLKGLPARATGLAFRVERHLLRRRIEMMIHPSRKQSNRMIGAAIGAAVLASMAATAIASQSLVSDRRITMAEASEMASRAGSEDGFPVVVNDLVLKELNRFVGTPEGRDFMRASLERMGDFKALVSAKIGEYRVPAELMAIPIVESGYRNLEQNARHASAGIWMFIPSTARRYGLRVDGQVDERLNTPLLTDVAMRYLKSNDLLFNDWLLAVMAYNVGEGKVREAIEKTGSRDAWRLVRAGYENDEAYLARVEAAILIMRNPESVL